MFVGIEPDAIGLATSADGRIWSRASRAPVFTRGPAGAWDRDRVAGCQALVHDGWIVLFYIGYTDMHTAAIGVARSRDGLSGWQRLSANPIVKPGSGWDADAVYKPYAIWDGSQWMLWYNGRVGGLEQIGVARHRGQFLGDFAS